MQQQNYSILRKEVVVGDTQSLFRNKRFALNKMFQRKTLQNLLYFMYKKTHVVFFVFHSVQLYIFT